MTRLRMTAWIFALALLAWAMHGSIALAQDGSIIYNKIDAQGYFRLWQINPDGSGDQHLPADAGYPIWSWDGQLIAASAPARPNVYSWNVFVYNTQTGDVQQVTSFEDYVMGERSNWVLALNKAFSPPGDRMAVSAYYHAQSTSGSTTAPILEIYSMDGNLLAQVAIANNASLHQGDGVDWSPNGDLLIYPYDAVAVAYGSGARVPVTALYRMAPVSDAIARGQARQLTFPRAVQYGREFSWEQDFQPAFSPDGQQVAYIRSLSGYFDSIPQFSITSIRIVTVDGTNDHEVARFQQGRYVSRVSWSPDGSMLVFDLGQQASSGGFPLPTADNRTMALYTMNADGTGLQQLQTPAALYPSWNPVGQ